MAKRKVKVKMCLTNNALLFTGNAHKNICRENERSYNLLVLHNTPNYSLPFVLQLPGVFKIWLSEKATCKILKIKVEKVEAMKQKITSLCLSLSLYLEYNTLKKKKMSQERWPANVECFPFNLAVSQFHLSDHCLDVC